MFNPCFFIMLCSLALFKSYAQQDSTKNNPVPLTAGQKLDNFLFKEQPFKIYSPPSPKKNTIYLQALGDTPWVGIAYSRRMYEKANFMIEMGGGLGLTPHFFENREPRPKDFSFSHHLRLVFRPTKLISPTVTYSGVWVSDEFFKEKMFNYWPTPMLGVRLGNSNSVAINLNWVGYFYNQNFIRLEGSDNVQRGFIRKVLSVPSANIQIAF